MRRATISVAAALVCLVACTASAHGNPEADLIEDLGMVERTEQQEQVQSKQEMAQELVAWKKHAGKAMTTTEMVEGAVSKLTSQDLHRQRIATLQEKLDKLAKEIVEADAQYIQYRNESDMLQVQLDRVQASCDLMAGKHSQMLHVISKLRDISSKHAANEWSRVMGLISVRETMQAGLSRKHAQSLQQNVGAAKKRAGRGPIDPAVLQSAFDVVYHQVTSDSNGHERTCNETIADLALRQEGAQAGASAAHAQNVQLQQSRDKLLASLAVEQRVKKTDGATANRYAGLVAQTAANFSMQNASHIENVARINQEITTSKQVLESIATIKTALKAYGYEAMMGMEKEEPPPPPAPGYSHDHVSDDILESGAGPQVIDSFGCNNSGGEHWCPTSQKCQRMWEEVCEPPRQVVGM